jgi:NADPH:quinone reductase-like Zn-dependent oxidoreductase
MRAVRIHAFGGPEQVVVEEIAAPALEPHHAKVRVVAAGVNPVDWAIREHEYNPRGADSVPMTLGQDFAGVVEEVAADARASFVEGDEVFGETWGSFAEHALVPVRHLVRKPATVDFVTAASLPMPGLTAWQLVVNTARVHRGTRILVHGAGGSVGSLCVQLAKSRGAHVIATASASSSRYLQSIGADEVIDYQRDHFETRVHEVDVVIEHLGGETQRRSIAVLRKGGMLINLGGEVDRRAARRAGVEAIAFGMEYRTRDLARVAELVADGVLRPRVSKVMPLRKARRALDLNQQNRSHGKIVLRVAA